MTLDVILLALIGLVGLIAHRIEQRNEWLDKRAKELNGDWA